MIALITSENTSQNSNSLDKVCNDNTGNFESNHHNNSTSK
jgi:hypothetical protein